MILPVRIYGDMILCRTASPVIPGELDIHDLANSMFQTIYDLKGLGLAAPQVGLSSRIIVVDISRSKRGDYSQEKPLVAINPIIESFDGECIYEEGCLSIPGIRVNISRPATITLRYLDIDFQEKTGVFSDLTARVLQHEIDHLDGILFIDRLSDSEKNVIIENLNTLSSE